MSSVEDKWWFVAACIPLFALPYAAWTWKAIVWDKLIMAGHTRTDTLTGPLAWSYSIIIAGIFLRAAIHE